MRFGKHTALSFFAGKPRSNGSPHTEHDKKNAPTGNPVGAFSFNLPLEA